MRFLLKGEEVAQVLLQVAADNHPKSLALRKYLAAPSPVGMAIISAISAIKLVETKRFQPVADDAWNWLI